MNTEFSSTEQVRQEITRRFTSLAFISSAIGKATLEAVRQHRQNGNPIAMWNGENVVIVQPENIKLPDDAE